MKAVRSPATSLSVLPRLGASWAPGSFGSDVTRLLLGSAGGRIIAAAALPLVTRLYTPADFQSFASYMAIVTTVAIAACLRLEVLLPIVECPREAARIFVLSVSAASLLCVALAIPILVSPGSVAVIPGLGDRPAWLPLVPVGIFAAAVYSAGKYWATRQRRFSSVAMSRVTQAATSSAIAVAGGFCAAGPLGLVFGGIVNVGAGCGRFIADMWSRDRTMFESTTITALRATLCRHRQHAVFSSLESLTNLAGSQVPILVVASCSDTEAGHLCLAMQLLALPMALLGTGVGQVFLSRAGEAKVHGTLANLTLDSLRPMFLVGVVPVMFAALLAPRIVPLLFGQPWCRTGELVLLMAPWIGLQILASPVSMALYVNGCQQIMLIIAVGGMCLRVGATVFASWRGHAGMMVPALSWASAAYYAILLVVILRITNVRRAHLRGLTPTVLATLIIAAVGFGGILVQSAVIVSR